MNRRSVFFSLAFSVVLILLVAEFFTTSKAAFTTPLDITFNFPLATSGSLMISGVGTEQVFRLGGSAPASGIFAGLDPKVGTAPSGGTLIFNGGSMAANVGANDFVYAFRVKNNSGSTGPLTFLQLGTCPGRKITSFGFIDANGFTAPLDDLFFVAKNLSGTFELPPGKESSILFYTSPDPPSIVDSSVAGSNGSDNTTSNATKLSYGACPVELTTDIKVACTGAILTDNPVTIASGNSVTYQIIVSNLSNPGPPSQITGPRLSNLVITDSTTGSNINSFFTVGGLPFTGTLNFGETAIATFAESPTSSLTKQVNVAGEYVIPNPNGTSNGGAPSGQTFPLPGRNSVLTDNVKVDVVAPPSLTSSFSITPATPTTTPTTFSTLPQTLTYSLKATNTGQTQLSTTFDLNPELKFLIANPPAGLVVSPAGSFTSPAQTIVSGGMATQTFTITANTLSAWLALADANKKTSSSILTVTATVAGSGAAACGITPITVKVPGQTNFDPPCELQVVKTIACDLGTGTPPDSNFSATAIVLKGAKVYYRYKVTNSSLLDTINSISVTDPLLNSAVNFGSLAPGAMQTMTMMATVPATIPSNLTVTVNGDCTQGTVSGTAASSISVADPKISAQKTVNGSIDLTAYSPPTELVWTLTTTNNSSGIPLNLKIDDPLLRGINNVVFKLGSAVVNLPYTATNVQPGNSIIITAAVTFANVSEFNVVADADQVLRNVVSVTGELLPGACTTGTTASIITTATSTVSLLKPPTTEVCIIRTCEPNCPPISPASEAVMKAPFSDDKPGSLLLYNLYTSSSSGDPAQNTRLSLTNVGSSTTFAHLFFIDGTTCNVSDTFACLSPNQTTSFLASEIDPGVTGYVVAVAVNEEGCPVSFNHLIGSAHVKFASGHTALLNAQAVAALYSGVLSNCTSSLAETVIKLDGIDYGLAPTTLVANTIFSQADKQSTMLIVNPVGGNLNTADSVKTIGTISGQVFDESERGFSFVAAVNRCQLQATMNDSFPRIPTRLSKVIGSGKVGMMRFATNDKAPIAGSIITFNPDVKLNASGFNQGHNLHYSALTNKATYTIPIFRPHI